MDGGLSQGHGEAAGRHRGGDAGGGAVVFPEAGFGWRDDLLHCQGVCSAVHYWVCFAVHFHSEQCHLDRYGLPFHGNYSSLFLFLPTLYVFHLCATKKPESRVPFYSIQVQYPFHGFSFCSFLLVEYNSGFLEVSGSCSASSLKSKQRKSLCFTWFCLQTIYPTIKDESNFKIPRKDL